LPAEEGERYDIMMSHQQPVLVATDLSARCDRAVDRAVMLASDWSVRLKVIHVLESGQIPSWATEEAVRSGLPNRNVDVDIITPSGSAPEVISRTAEETNSRVIVMGVARYNHARDYFIGTAVDYVVRASKVPVLVVKQRSHAPYKALLVATDLSDCSRAALLRAAELFPSATLHLIHAYHVPFEGWLKTDEACGELEKQAQQALDNFIRDPQMPDAVRHRLDAKVGYGDVGEVLLKALSTCGADLVVLGTHGRSGISHATIGSTAEFLMTWLAPDTLMVRE
jgi:nucleotide-binding universal stress UspA family protein